MSKECRKIMFNKYILERELNRNKGQEYQINKNAIFSLLPENVKYENNEKYFGDIKNDNEHYIGVLTSNFNKELFGYLLINQGDEYLGQILKEQKNGFGVYKFNSNKEQEQEKEKEVDIFIGNFADNKINGEGIYINILNNGNNNVFNSAEKISKFICYIGMFEDGLFKKGKIYTVDNGNEKLEFIDDEIEIEENNQEDKVVVSFGRKNNVNIYQKGINKDKKLYEGDVIYFGDNEEIKNKFSFKMNNNLQYDFKYLDDENKEKKLIEEFNASNFLKYKKAVHNILTKIETMIDRMKKEFQYGRNLIIDDNFKKAFNDDYKLLINKA